MKRWREEGKITPAPCLRSHRSPSSLVSFVLCISMIKRWWNRAAGRSLDTETMLSLEQASTAAEQPLRDRATTTHTLVHTPAASHTCKQTCKHTQNAGLLRPRGLTRGEVPRSQERDSRSLQTTRNKERISLTSSLLWDHVRPQIQLTDNLNHYLNSIYTIIDIFNTG